MLILETQRRAVGHAYAAVLTVRWGEDVHTLILQHHPVTKPPWQSSLHTDDVRTPPLWQSVHYESATQAIDALLERIAPLGLSDDLLPLVNNLLPPNPVGCPLWE